MLLRRRNTVVLLSLFCAASVYSNQVLAKQLRSPCAVADILIIRKDIYRQAFDWAHPGWVLVTTVNKRTGKSQLVCVNADELERAILIERNLPRSQHEKATEIASNSQARIFRFSKRKALELVKPKYSQKSLIEVRQILGKCSRKHLIKKFHEEWITDASQDSLWLLKDNQKTASAKDTGHSAFAALDLYGKECVVAHVLLEHGILPRVRCCGVAALFVVPDEQRHFRAPNLRRAAGKN